MRTSLGIALVIGFLCGPLVGCGGDDDGTPPPGDGGTTARDSGPRRDGGSTTGDPWSVNAVERRAMLGMMFSYDCPAPGTAYTVWGTDIYSDDSSVCTAGVHAGAITLAAGGTVRIQILAGQATYTGSESNGIVSMDWDTPWEGSFEVVP